MVHIKNYAAQLRGIACFIRSFIFFSISSASLACSVQDDTGAMLKLSSPAKRVISLAPDITETLFAIGANQQLVGVIEGSNFPVAAKQIPIVGSYAGLDQETIVALHPDLIITWGENFSRQLTFFRKQHIPIYVVQSHQLNDVAHTMENIGCLLGKEQAAHQAAASYLQTLQSLTRTYQTKTPVTVYYQIGSGFFTINQTSWINQAITFCGGKNIFANAKLPAPEVDMEAILAADPDVIISDNSLANAQAFWAAWPQLKAVKQRAIYSVSPDLLERAGPRLILGVQKICQILNEVRSKAKTSQPVRNQVQ